MNITFKALQQNDLPLLHCWFQDPVVKKWYARGIDFSWEDIHKKYLPRILSQEEVFSFIVNIGETPIGLIQYYALNHFLPEGIQSNSALFRLAQPNQIAGIDFFIGESSYRGQGFAKGIIQQFSETYLTFRFLIEVVDPAANNTIAIQFYQNCGFSITDYSEDKNFLLLMR